MQVKTNTGFEPVDFNKIIEKIKKYNYNLSPLIDPHVVAQKTIQSMVDGITTTELDHMSANIAANFTNIHPDYSILGARILVSRLHKQLKVEEVSFAKNIARMYSHIHFGKKSTRISKEVFDFCNKYESELESILDYGLDYNNYDYPAIMSYYKSSLRKIDGVVAETPNQMFLRVAVGLHIPKIRSEAELDNFEEYSGFRPNKYRLMNLTEEQRLEEIKTYYYQLAHRKVSPQSPIIVHAASEMNQMPSCYLQYCGDSLTGDNYSYDGIVKGILGSLTQLAAQGKSGGATGVNISDIRSKGSYISKTGGVSNGILPFMKMFDSSIAAINQGGRRAGVCTLYIEPWHKDILDFLDAGDHFTIEEKRCKNIFYALYTNDLFFKRLITDQNKAKWTLFDPAEVVSELGFSLSDVYGDEFESAYLKLENSGIGEEINLMEIWNRVCKLIQISGNPYIVHKDSVNGKSNQQNIGVIKGSNVCCEITLVSNQSETGVCVLSSISLPRFVDSKAGTFNFEELIQSSRIATKSLNNVLDIQHYPTPETRNSSLNSRAIGVGAQGLADVYAMLKLDFDSPEAQNLNKKIYEAIYYGCLKESMELAKIEGPYNYYKGSPISKGILQYDMWGFSENDLRLDKNKWLELKKDIVKYGVRNSEVTALMPTASSSIRMGNNEMHEPFTRNIYVRQYIGGSVRVINKYLVNDLINLSLWNEELCNKIIFNEGSIQGISEIPSDIRSRYRTAYEIDFKQVINMMADRSPFISQASSFNHFVTYQDSGPTAFTQRIIHAWKKGLKTLSYYIHTETASTAKKELGGLSITEKQGSTLNTNPEYEKLIETKIVEDSAVCRLEEGCEVCSS
ncbi:MAG: ribonucleoside-diphosphate reductase subunit alpha [Patescibacteria group bacterium]